MLGSLDVQVHGLGSCVGYVRDLGRAGVWVEQFCKDVLGTLDFQVDG